jgi:hypothetical protein
VSYISLFLTSPIPPLPQGVQSARVVEADAWRASLERSRDTAWADMVEFCHRNGVEFDDNTKVLAFNKQFTSLIDELDANDIPQGVQGRSAYGKSLDTCEVIKERKEQRAKGRKRTRKEQDETS